MCTPCLLVAAIICKNEEAVIERCVASIRDQVDEIHICDTGSTDSTLQILKDLRDPKVYVYTDYTWNRNFAEARNHANSKCAHAQWILSVDCDSVMRATAEQTVKEYVSCLGADVGAVNVLHDWGSTTFLYPKLSRNDTSIYYKYSYHNVLHMNGVSWKTVSNPKIVFCEKRHPQSAEARQKRHLDQIAYFESINISDPLDTRAWFYGARVLMDNGRPAEAIEKFAEHAKLLPWREELYVSHLYAGRCHARLGCTGKARSCWTRAFEVDPQRIEAVGELVQSFKDKGEYRAALLWGRWGAHSVPASTHKLFSETSWLAWKVWDLLALSAW